MPPILQKSFGQHFLHDTFTVQRMLDALSPNREEVIVEIGPGKGALSLPLLKACGKLTAIELDNTLIPGLQAKATHLGQLSVICADVLEVDFTALARGYGTPDLRLTGNLPYYISSPILFHCLRHINAIRDMHFMLQKEVVDRLAASPGSKIYGRLSVILQLTCQVQPLFTVPPRAFWPPPRVDSAVVRLLPKPPEQRHHTHSKRLHVIVRAAFAQRRKTLGNALRQLLNTDAIRRAGIDPKTRAETLTPEEFVHLSRVKTSPS